MEPYDEKAIAPDDLIIRRIDPFQHIVTDENRKCRRISSKAFSPSTNGGMSVDIEKLILAAGLDPRQYVTTPKYIGSVAFSAGSARAAKLFVGYDPLPENPFHGEVWGNPRPDRFTGTQKKKLAAASEWYVQIPGVEI
jgi:hypothetical protein